MRKISLFLIRISISVGILLFLFKRVDLNKIIQIISNANKPILGFVLLLSFLSYFVAFLRWKMLLTGLRFNLANSSIFKSFCIGLFSNLFFPSTVGGDFLRCIDLGVRTQEPRRVVASVILDRISGYSALMVVALLALLLGYKIIDDIAVFFSLGIILIFLALILAILFNNFLFQKSTKLLRLFGRMGETLINLRYEIYNFRSQKRLIVKNFLHSLIIHLSMSFLIYLISRALGARISPIYFFILVPIISSISALPISIAGLGLREASSMYFLTRVGLSGELALALALLVFFMVFLFGLIGGIIYVFTFSHRRI